MEFGAPYNITADDAYRIVQVAAFNILEPGDAADFFREQRIKSLQHADEALLVLGGDDDIPESIQIFIPKAALRVPRELELGNDNETAECRLARWNQALTAMFADTSNLERWNSIFTVRHQLRNEYVIYEEVLGSGEWQRGV
jgi:hypothetical protein